MTTSKMIKSILRSRIFTVDLGMCYITTRIWRLKEGDCVAIIRYLLCFVATLS